MKLRARWLFALPLLLRRGVPFVPSLLISMALTALSYFLMVQLLKRFGIVI